MHASKKVIVYSTAIWMAVTGAIAHAQILGSEEKHRLVVLRNNCRPVIEHIYQEQTQVLSAGERKELGNARVFFSLDLHFRTFRAIQFPPDKRGIHLGIGDLSHLLELSTAWVVGSTFNDVNEYGWARSYAILLRRARLDYLRTGRIQQLPQALRVMGISRDDLSREQIERTTALQENTIRFFMAHELGHLVHSHLSARRTGEDFGAWMRRSRRQEREADRFALSIMLRTKQPPLAVMGVFGLWLMADLDEKDSPESKTHPLTHNRMRDICEFTVQHSKEFGLDAGKQRELNGLRDSISLLVKMLETDREEVVRDWNRMARRIRIQDLRIKP